MHPKALLDACAELVQLTLKFDHPADAVVSPLLPRPPRAGPARARHAGSRDGQYTVLRKKLLFDHFARPRAAARASWAGWPFWGFTVPRDFLKVR